MEKATAASKLITSHRHGVLCTNSVKHPGFPFGSVTPYALDSNGRPIFLISRMAVHTKNLEADPHASLLVSEESPSTGLMSGTRANVMGIVHSIPAEEIDAASNAYLSIHPAAAQWAGFGDFGFYRMDVAEIYYVGGFGVMGWVSGSDYLAVSS
jgi:heme iron utilization protein